MAAATGTTVAEFYRKQGRDTLVVIDDIDSHKMFWSYSEREVVELFEHTHAWHMRRRIHACHMRRRIYACVLECMHVFWSYSEREVVELFELI